MRLEKILRQHLLYLHKPHSQYACRAYLRGAYLRGATLSGATLSDANLSGANLSGAKGLISQYDFLQSFQKTQTGIIVHKTFDEHYKPNENWKIEVGSILEEVCNLNPVDTCGCGINVASLEWCQLECSKVIWKCEIPYGAAICVPYNTDGKFRTERLKLIEKIGE